MEVVKRKEKQKDKPDKMAVVSFFLRLMRKI